MPGCCWCIQPIPAWLCCAWGSTPWESGPSLLSLSSQALQLWNKTQWVLPRWKDIAMAMQSSAPGTFKVLDARACRESSRTWNFAAKLPITRESQDVEDALLDIQTAEQSRPSCILYRQVICYYLVRYEVLLCSYLAKPCHGISQMYCYCKYWLPTCHSQRLTLQEDWCLHMDKWQRYLEGGTLDISLILSNALWRAEASFMNKLPSYIEKLGCKGAILQWLVSFLAVFAKKMLLRVTSGCYKSLRASGSKHMHA